MRYPEIGSDFFVRNRQKLIGLLEGDSIAIIHSNDQMVRSGDQYFPYRQSPDLFYLCGIEQEMTVLMISPAEPESVRLFIRKADPKLETWEGKKLDKKMAEDISGIRNIQWLENFESSSRELILESDNIYCASHELVKFRPDHPSRDQRYLNKLKIDFPLHRLKRLSPFLAELRMVKEPEELALILKAVEITKGGFERLLSFVKPGCKEYEVEAEITHEYLQQGANGHGYQPIIASGVNATILHYLIKNAINNRV